MEIGQCVVLRDSVTFDDLGVCQAPPPVEVGDVVGSSTDRPRG